MNKNIKEWIKEINQSMNQPINQLNYEKKILAKQIGR